LLRWRLLLGALLIGALIGLLWIDYHASPPAMALFVLVLVFGLAAAQEVISLLATAGHRPHAGVIYAGTLLVIASNAIPLFLLSVPDDRPLERLAWPLLAFTIFGVLGPLVVEMIRYRQPGGVMVKAALATFAIAYVGLLMSFALHLRVLGGSRAGMVALAALVIVVKMGDTGAYTVGRLIGRHKMAPLISPGKTMEGAGGAVLFSCLGAWFAFTWLPVWMDADIAERSGSWLLFGLLVGLAGLAGDLAESLFKRDLGSKDSSSWLPGFGGVLDIVDSLLFAAPVAYLCWWLGMA
jgi:phosphatidate cytidylyltransferase